MSTPTSPLRSSTFRVTETCELAATRMASKPASMTLKPLTRSPLVPRMPMPTLPGSLVFPMVSGGRPLGLMTAPGVPYKFSGLVMTTCSA